MNKPQTKKGGGRFPPGGYLLLAAVVLASLVVPVAAAGDQGEAKPAVKQGENWTSKIKPESVPLVNYYDPDPAAPRGRSARRDPPARALRQARNRRYDGQRVLPKDASPGDEFVDQGHWWQGLTALPVYPSEAILLGTVTDAQAYLSNDKGMVYSEFTLRVEQVFKNDVQAPVSPGHILGVTRRVGRIRYAPRIVARWRVLGQGVPQPGRRYVFFLWEGDRQGAYSIITAYEFTGAGRVIPLDGAVVETHQSEWPFDVYMNAEESRLVRDLETALAQTPPKPFTQEEPNPSLR